MAQHPEASTSAVEPIDTAELARIRAELTNLGKGFRHGPPPTTRNQVHVLHEIGRDLLAYATRLLAALDPAGGQVETVAASRRAYADREDVWALLDAESLVSLHGTEQGARDAREVHLAQLSSWSAEMLEQYALGLDIISLHVEQP
jgi:hypothetical protein